MRHKIATAAHASAAPMALHLHMRSSAACMQCMLLPYLMSCQITCSHLQTMVLGKWHPADSAGRTKRQLAHHSHPGPGWISWAAPSCCTENCAAPARSATSMITVHAPSSSLHGTTDWKCSLGHTYAATARKEEARSLVRAHPLTHGVYKVTCGAAWAARCAEHFVLLMCHADAGRSFDCSKHQKSPCSPSCLSGGRSWPAPVLQPRCA